MLNPKRRGDTNTNLSSKMAGGGGGGGREIDTASPNTFVHMPSTTTNPEIKASQNLDKHHIFSVQMCTQMRFAVQFYLL